MKSICRQALIALPAIFVLCWFPTAYALADEEADKEGDKDSQVKVIDHSVSLGLSLTSGNSESLVMNGSWDAELVRKKTKTYFRVQGNYGRTEVEDSSTGKKTDVVTAKDVKFSGNAYHTISDRFYTSPVLSIEYDKVAGVDFRLMVGQSLGAYLVRTDRMTLGLDVGPAYIRDDLTDGTEDHIGSLRVGERFDMKVSEKAKIWQSIEYLADFAAFKSYLLNTEIGAETALVAGLSLRVVLQNEYDNKPAEGRKHNDLALISSLVWKF